EPLIGPDTVNTLPPETLTAYRKHGRPSVRLEHNPEQPDKIIAGLAKHGIDLEAVARQLEEEGVRKFIEPFDKLLAALDQRRRKITHEEPV
ncbi:MAG TPA: transaldolase family protein, partial [Sulfuricaulis sp.]|nr:transaldolase family protein [Sulfuricaulis sp.]